MNIEDLQRRCRAMCGAEAVAMGLPAELGYAVYDGCVADSIENWNEKTFLGWVGGLSKAFGVNGDDWRPLYKRVCEVMGEYGRLAKQ